MAKYNLDKYTKDNGFGMSLNIRRGDPNPLDNSSVWPSLSEAQTYAQTDPTAYVGQVLTVVTTEGNTKTSKVYVINNEAGDLVEVTGTVDTELDAESTNPVQNKAIKAALDGKQASGDYALSSEVPTKTSELTNDSGYITGITVDESLSDTSTNPVQNKVIKKALDGKADSSHGTHVTYGTSASGIGTTSSAGTASDISRSDHVHALTKDNVTTALGYTPLDADEKYTHPNSDVVAGTYTKVTVNAQGHITSGSNPTTLDGYGITNAYTKTEVDNKITEIVSGGEVTFDGYVTEDEWNERALAFATKTDLEDYTKTAELPTKVSQFENDSKYLTDVPDEYITETELAGKGYITDISGKSDIGHKHTISEITDYAEPDTSNFITKDVDNLANYYTKTQVDTASGSYVTCDDVNQSIQGIKTFNQINVGEANITYNNDNEFLEITAPYLGLTGNDILGLVADTGINIYAGSNQESKIEMLYDGIQVTTAGSIKFSGNNGITFNDTLTLANNGMIEDSETQLQIYKPSGSMWIGTEEGGNIEITDNYMDIIVSNRLGLSGDKVELYANQSESSVIEILAGENDDTYFYISPSGLDVTANNGNINFTTNNQGSISFTANGEESSSSINLYDTSIEYNAAAHQFFGEVDFSDATVTGLPSGGGGKTKITLAVLRDMIGRYQDNAGTLVQLVYHGGDPDYSDLCSNIGLVTILAQSFIQKAVTSNISVASSQISGYNNEVYIDDANAYMAQYTFDLTSGQSFSEQNLKIDITDDYFDIYVIN